MSRKRFRARPPQPPQTVSDAQLAIEADRKQRYSDCAAAVEKVFKDYRCAPLLSRSEDNQRNVTWKLDVLVMP